MNVDADSRTQVYSYDSESSSFPKNLVQKYNAMAKFIACVRETTPKVLFK